MKKLLKGLIDRGYVVSIWKNKKNKYEVEISLPEDAGSVCESGDTILKALEKSMDIYGIGWGD